MTIALAFSTNAFTRFTLDEALRRIAGHGYRGVEVLADAPHAVPERTSDAEAERLRGLLGELALTVANINDNTMFHHWTDAPPEPFFEPALVSEDPELRAVRLANILRTLEIAPRLGARNISITTGKPLGGMSPEACEPVLRDGLMRVLDRAEAVGVDVGIECEPGLLVETSDELLALIDRVGSARLGANLDIGHALVSGEDPAEAVRRLRGRIWNLHVEDIRDRKHYHRIPGEGDVDFAALAAALRETGYDRWATLELYTCAADPNRAASESLRILKPFFD